MEIDGEIAEFADHVVSTCALDSLSIFVCDNSADVADLHYLFHVGVSDEAKHVYRDKRVFELDPYASQQLRERPEFASNESILLAKDPRLNGISVRHSDYWRFLADHDVEVVGASAKRFMRGLYLVVGAHCQTGKHNPSEVPIAKLDADLHAILDKVTGQIFDSMLKSRLGSLALRQALAPPNAKNLTGPQRLSPREIEIAHLVGQGKRNKEISRLAGLSEYTVENHLRRIYRKLGVRNRAALVARIAPPVS